jgi:predicted nuclease of predicted toxin-antitoxin system
MKLLLDENLSRRLLPPLSDTYPDSTHVALIGLERATDMAVWDIAAANDDAVALVELTATTFPPSA